MTMMNTKKGRAWFVPGLVVLPVLLFYLSFFRGEEMGSSPGRQLELQTFQSGDGWGYQIRMNGKVLIYQPTIPSIDTVIAFPDKESAENIGTLVLNKLAGLLISRFASFFPLKRKRESTLIGELPHFSSK